MKNILTPALWVILRREFSAYFSTPLAYIFILIFLVLSGVFAFYLGSFYERGQADLNVFFSFHPWLYLFLVPALSMRLWAEERSSGSIELLLTLPVTRWDAALGKFLAAWLFTGAALLMTMPLWFTTAYLGDPDNGVIFAAYLGSWLMSGGFLAVGCCMSALTRSQVIAFIITAATCFLFILAGYPPVLDLFSWAPAPLVDAIADLSFLTHFQAVSRGVLSLRDVLYYIAFIAVWLAATVGAIEMRQAN